MQPMSFVPVVAPCQRPGALMVSPGGQDSGQELRLARRAQARATRALHSAAARLYVAGLLSAMEVQALRLQLRRGRPNRFATLAEIDQVTSEFVATARAFSARLAEASATQSRPASSSDRPPKPAPASVPRADELPSSEHERLRQRIRLIALFDAHPRLRDIDVAQQVGLDRSTVGKLRRRFALEGAAALVDRRLQPERTPHVLTAPVTELLLGLWSAHPAAGIKAIWRLALEQCDARGLPAPSYVQAWRFLSRRPPTEQALRAGDHDLLRRSLTPVVRFTLANRANERFQNDHQELPIWVRGCVAGAETAQRVWITVFLDEYSRTVAGFSLGTTYPDAWSIALALHHAIRPKAHPGWLNHGLPEVIQPDHGRDFLSSAIEISCAYLGIRIDPDPPHYPNRKGKIERFFETLDHGCLRLLSGHHAAHCVSHGAAQKILPSLLCLSELRGEIERFLVEEYHARVHRELKAPPAQRWSETVRLRLPTCDDALCLLLMPANETRVVQNTGISFRGNSYMAPALVRRIKQEVTVRYNPEDDHSVLVYDVATGEWICEAAVMGRPDSIYAADDLKADATRYRRELLERTRARMEQVAREGRVARAQDEALEIVAHAPPRAAAPKADAVSQMPAAVEALVAALEANARGEAPRRAPGGHR
jgi:putative transposase